MEATVTTDSAAIAGVWILRSFHIEEAGTGRRTLPFGPDPSGALIMHPGGRMIAVLTPKAAAQPATEAERAEAYRTMVAYSGRYRLEPPDRFVTTVDVAWFPGWVGTDQARTYTLAGDRLDIVSAPVRLAGSDVPAVGVLSWAREKAGG